MSIRYYTVADLSQLFIPRTVTVCYSAPRSGRSWMRNRVQTATASSVYESSYDSFFLGGEVEIFKIIFDDFTLYQALSDPICLLLGQI